MLTTNFSLLHTAHCCTQTRNCVTQLRTIVSFLPFFRPIVSMSSGRSGQAYIHRLLGESLACDFEGILHLSRHHCINHNVCLFSWSSCLIGSMRDLPQKLHCRCKWHVCYHGEVHAFLSYFFILNLYGINYTLVGVSQLGDEFLCVLLTEYCVKTSYHIHHNYISLPYDQLVCVHSNHICYWASLHSFDIERYFLQFLFQTVKCTIVSFKRNIILFFHIPICIWIYR